MADNESSMRHGRIRIRSQQGYNYDTQVTVEGTGEQLLKVAAMQLDVRPGQPVRAYVTCLLPSLDVVADAQIEETAVECHILRGKIDQACDALEFEQDPARRAELAHLLRESGRVMTQHVEHIRAQRAAEKQQKAETYARAEADRRRDGAESFALVE